jgi:membrane-bound serine protease (ClpP class)
MIPRMKTRQLLGALTLATLLLSAGHALAAPQVWLMNLEGAISPATADYFTHTLEDAQQAGAAVLIVRLDTPGGLDQSMRAMIKEILASAIPVVIWVAPNGSRAASAGTYLLYASHVAAMAPATNVGSSTPVSIGGGSPFPMPGTQPAERERDRDKVADEDESATDGGATPDRDGNRQRDAAPPGDAMDRKVINDAVAYIRGLAKLRNRNADWAEKTVREAANLTAADALDEKVIDLIAKDLDALLEALNGRTVAVEGGDVTLDLTDAEVTTVEPGWRYEFLALITDPNVAYILLMIGIYGLILEFYNPGTTVPGVTGVICLLLGAYALQMLPVNYAGLALMLLGIALMVAEVFVASFGVLGIGGVISFVMGSIILMDSGLPGYQISLPIIIAFAASSAAIFLFGFGAAMHARNLRVVSGREAMIGAEAVAQADFDDVGPVRAFSENWQARSAQPVRKGERLTVTGIDGLVLTVEPRE